MDHYGLVAAICQELKIAEKIDGRLPQDPQGKVSPGTVIVAMIINGLGFSNRRLYLTHQFFESKTVAKLLGQDLEAGDITDYTLEEILEDYKERQDVERGFRFLKDPWFMVDSVFLKLPRRIEALMMVMASV